MILNTDGVDLYYEITGSGSSKVLLLHGWGCDGSFMKSLSDALAEDHSVMIPDFPAHGKSGRPPEPWGVPEYSDCLIHLLQKTDFLPCAVVAHSFGCRVAAWAASQKQDLFTKLVFTGAAGLRKPSTPESEARTREYKRKMSRLKSLRNIPLLGIAADRMADKLRKRYGSPDYLALDEEMRKTFVKVINQDLRDCYPGISQSTLLVFGTEDTETPLWMGEEMEKLIPDAGLVKLEGGSHFAFLEQASRFNLIVKHFLKEE